jgi:FMN phosphatase YigB (HAD superfamily)
VLSQIGSDAGRAVMVGDSLTRDVDGAIAAGLGAVWVNRFGSPRPTDRPDLIEVSTLGDLPAALELSDVAECTGPWSFPTACRNPGDTSSGTP